MENVIRSPPDNFSLVAGALIEVYFAMDDYNLLSDIQLPTVDDIVLQNYYEQPDEWSVLCPPKHQPLPTNLTEDRLLADWELLKADRKRFKEKERDFERLHHISIDKLLEKEKSIDLKSTLIESLMHGHPLDAKIIKHNLLTPFRSYLEIIQGLEKYPGLKELVDRMDGEGLGSYLRQIFAYLSSVTPTKLQANLRASDLIKQWLTKKEVEQLMEKGYVEIKKGKKIYRVFEDYSERVEVYSKGKMEYSLCGYVAEWKEDHDMEINDSFVLGDHFLAKIIAIKSDPEYYEKHSNRYNTRE